MSLADAMITNASGAQMKHVRDLLAKSKYRTEQGQYVVEGIRMVRELMPEDIISLYVSESFEKTDQMQSLSVPAELVSDSVFEKISDTKTPQGVLAVAKQKHWQLQDLLQKERVTLFFLERLQDPGNLGTIIRCAEGAGVDGIILSPGCADVYNPKVIRSTMGSVLRVPIVAVSDWEETLCEAMAAQVELFAAHLQGTCDYDQVAYPAKTGVLIGNEANGITEATAHVCDHLVKIPMEGKVESLNAAIAASVFMSEIYRQKRQQGRVRT